MIRRALDESSALTCRAAALTCGVEWKGMEGNGLLAAPEATARRIVPRFELPADVLARTPAGSFSAAGNGAGCPRGAA